MRRRRILALGGVALAGCVGPVSDGGTPGTRVEVVSWADQPGVPVEYEVEVTEPRATADHPARIRVSITNPTDRTVVLGEERDVQFHHAMDDDREVYLFPAGDTVGPVEPGCWQLTEPIPIAAYYGTLPIEAGETVRAESYVYGHYDLPKAACLPEGEHRIRTTGKAGEEEWTPGEDATEFEWGFTLRIGE